MRKKLLLGIAPLLVIFIGLVVTIAAGGVLFKSKQIKLPVTISLRTPSPSPSPTLSPGPTAAPTDQPRILSPIPNQNVRSPLVVLGSVPSGWMFEGIFPIKLVDASRKLIVEGQANEVTPSSWMGSGPVDFRAILTFSTTASSGFLILQNDNPSGLPTNSKSFEVPVNF